MRKDCIWRRDPRVTRKRKIESAADAIASDCSYNRQARPLDQTHRALAFARKFERFRGAQSCQFRNVRTDGKRALGARENAPGSLAFRVKLFHTASDLCQILPLYARKTVVTFQGKDKQAILRRAPQTRGHCAAMPRAALMKVADE